MPENPQYTAAYVDGVQKIAFTSAHAALNINWSNASGWYLNYNSGTVSYPWEDVSDFMLWTQNDIVCGGTGTSATGCGSAGTIPATDLAYFWDGTKPKSPTSVIASLGVGQPDILLTGASTAFGANSSTLTGHPTISVTGGPVADVPSGPSASSSHTVYKWICQHKTGAVGSTTLTTDNNCGNVIASGDLLVAAYAGIWSTTTTAGTTCGTPTGFTQAFQGFNNTNTDPILLCAFYKTAGGAETGSYGMTLSTGANITRDSEVALIDLGPATFDVANTSSTGYGTSMSSTAITTGAANDLTLAIYTNYNVSHAPYACPTTGIYSGWQGRQLNTALDYSSGAQELLVCLVQVPSSSTSTGTLAVTTGGNDTWVAGQLAVTPNSMRALSLFS